MENPTKNGESEATNGSANAALAAELLAIVNANQQLAGESNQSAEMKQARSNIEVEVEGVLTAVEILSEAAVDEMADLDKRLFGEHKALSAGELSNIQQHGALLAIRNAEGVMVAEAQVITEAIPGAEEPLVNVLPPDSGYREGSAVDPDYRGQNVGIALARAAEEVIRREGKTDAWATVRVENAASLRNLTKEGYFVVGYSEQYYEGEELSGARLVVRKDLQESSEPNAELEMALAESMPMAAGEGIDASVNSLQIPFESGDAIDAAAHALVRQALEAGFIGIGVTRQGEQSVMVFKRLEQHGDSDVQSRVRERQAFLRSSGIA